MLLHSDPFLFYYANQISATASDFITVPDAVVFYYPVAPAMQQFAFSNLVIFEDFPAAFCTFHSYHLFISS